MKKLLLCLLLAACADPRGEGVIQTLKSAGYSDVKLTGWDAFSCSDDDTFSTGFTAKGPTGLPVKGVVCSNLLLKGSTIRLR